MSSTSPSSHLQQTLKAVRRRWRLRRSLSTLSLAVPGAVVALLALTWTLDWLRYAEPATTVLRWLSYGFGLGLIAVVARPWFRQVDDRAIAFYLEGREPSLQAVVLSAAEADRHDDPRQAPLRRRLLAHAEAACQTIDYGRRAEAIGLKKAQGALLAALALVAAVAWWSPNFLNRGLVFLLPHSTAVSPYFLAVSPGDAEVARGSDPLLTVQAEGFTPGQATVVVEGDGAQRTVAMAPGTAPGQFEIYLFDLAQSVDYWMEAEGVRSARYRLEVVDVPKVAGIDLTYRYPAYSRLPPRTVEDGGDIRALEDTVVELAIATTHPATEGVVATGDAEIPLTSTGDTTWRGQLTVAGNDQYRIRLKTPRGNWVDASPRYTITAVADQAPQVTFKSPGRDIKVTRLEEPRIQVEARDDLGLAELTLVTRINGGPERPVTLAADPGDPLGADGTHDDSRTFSGERVMYLEDLELRPGDFISYYARATDQGQAQPTTTDMYFFEVRPFRRTFRAADQGGGGGGGGSLDGALSAQQRQLVVAVFNTLRDRDTYRPEALQETWEVLAQSQGRIRQRVEAIVRRLQSRPVVGEEPGYQQMVESLPQAVTAMADTEARLAEQDPEGALSPAQTALQHLLRAEAAFREAQVARANQGGGGQGGMTDAEDLANLFKLEMDKLRNPYETVQRARERAPERELDDIMEKLKELAERQQRALERQGLPSSNSGGGESRDLERLTAATEELARRLERLTRERPETDRGTGSEVQRQAMEQALEELQQAAQQLAEAQDQGSETQREAARRALDRLQQAQTQLEEGQQRQLAEGLASARQRAEALDRRQEEIRRAVAEREGPTDFSRIEDWQLFDNKTELADEVQSLAGEVRRLAQEAREQNSPAQTPLDQAATTLGDDLADTIRNSRQDLRLRTPNYVLDQEDRITTAIDRAKSSLTDADQRQRGAATGDDPTATLEAMRALVRDLEAARQRLAQGTDGQGQGRQPGAGLANAEATAQNQAQGQGQGRGPQGGARPNPGTNPETEGSLAGNPGAPSPSGSGGGSDGGNVDAEGGWSGVPTPEQWTNWRDEARRLGRSLEAQGRDAGDIQQLLQQLLALEQAILERPELLSRFETEIIDPLKALEYRLRQTEDPRHRPTVAGGEVPPAYQEQVAAYFRRLSQGLESTSNPTP